LEIELLDLNKIKEYFINTEELEAKFFQSKSNYEKLQEIKEKIKSSIEGPEIIDKIKDISEKLELIYTRLLDISQNNLKILITFQDKLTKNYKQVYIEKLKNLDITNQKVKKIGLTYIKDKKISKIIKNISFIPSLTISQWSDLLDSLSENVGFLETIKKVENFYQLLLKKKFKKELTKISEHVPENLINDYKKAFFEEPTLSFKDFIRSIEAKLSEEELTQRKDLIEKTKKKEELAFLKKQQQEQKTTFEDYFKYPEKEFQRIRRKKQRKSLSEIAQEPEKEAHIEDEKKEKIEKFKSKFEKSFDKVYLNQKEDSSDPLDLIRKRKKKKEEEYKNFMKKFKKDEK
jgi:hypothetical protein